MSIRLADTVELIKADLVDLTEGAFHVWITSDDGGTHIEAMIEDHSNSTDIRTHLDINYKGSRIILKLIPEGWLSVFRPDDRRRDK